MYRGSKNETAKEVPKEPLRELTPEEYEKVCAVFEKFAPEGNIPADIPSFNGALREMEKIMPESEVMNLMMALDPEDTRLITFDAWLSIFGLKPVNRPLQIQLPEGGLPFSTLYHDERVLLWRFLTGIKAREVSLPAFYKKCCAENESRMRFGAFRDQIIEEENLFLAITEDECQALFDMWSIPYADFYTNLYILGKSAEQGNKGEFVYELYFFLTTQLLT